MLGNSLGEEGSAALAQALRRHPGKLRELFRGVDISVFDRDLPLELKGTDNATILNFYHDLLAEPSVVSRRCRLMLLGNGGVGKTTLARRLEKGAPAAVGADVTHGVLQRAWCPFALVHLFPNRFLD